jgi:hypothetical protein
MLGRSAVPCVHVLADQHDLAHTLRASSRASAMIASTPREYSAPRV